MADERLNLEEKKFCGGCRNKVNLIIVAKHFREEEEYETDWEDIRDENGFVVNRTEIVVRYNKYILWSELLECPTPDCRKTYLRTYCEGDALIEESIIPKSEPWYKEVKRSFQEHVPSKVLKIYQECITAFNLVMNYTCGFLLGAILETICNHEGIKGIIINEEKNKLLVKGRNQKEVDSKKFIINLHIQIEALVKNKKLKKKFLNSVLKIKEIRNEVTHDIYSPSTKELELSIKLIEQIFEDMYLRKPHRLKTKKDQEELQRKLIELFYYVNQPVKLKFQIPAQIPAI